MEVCKVSKHPVTANHTNAQAVFDHPRCKSDDQIKAIADTGGLIGISCVPFFLAEDPLSSVVLGTGKMLDDMALLRRISLQ